MFFKKLIVLNLALSQVLGAVAPNNYLFPSSWPSADLTNPLDGAFLEDPMVTAAFEQVLATVPAQYLNIPPSINFGGGVVNYTADTVANCYFPSTSCYRTANNTPVGTDIYQCPGANVWGLTYDDGPSVNLVNGQHVDDTHAVREALAQNNLKATFFIVGARAVVNPAEVLQHVQAGHQIGLHTWTHHPLTTLSNKQIVAEIKYTEAVIYKATGVLPVYFRPPYGDIDDRGRAIIKALGYKNVIWTVNPMRDTRDSDVANTPANADSIEATVKTWFVPQNGFISLEHDFSTFTSNLSTRILAEIKAAGNTFPLTPMPVGTCMNDSKWFSNINGTISANYTWDSNIGPPFPSDGQGSGFSKYLLIPVVIVGGSLLFYALKVSNYCADSICCACCEQPLAPAPAPAPTNDSEV